MGKDEKRYGQQRVRFTAAYRIQTGLLALDLVVEAVTLQGSFWRGEFKAPTSLTSQADLWWSERYREQSL